MARSRPTSATTCSSSASSASATGPRRGRPNSWPSAPPPAWSPTSSGFFASEHVDPNLLEVAATDLGTTVGNHVDAAFLVDQQLDAAAIEAGLLTARPLDQIYPKGDPTRDPYVRLVKALAPRLRTIAPKLPPYEVERDAQFFAEFENLADDTGKILAAIADIKPTIETIAADVKTLVNLPGQLADGYDADYLAALCAEHNRVEIIGLTVDEPARGGELDVAYLSLRTRLGLLGETQSVDFATMLTLLPKLGGRVLIEGPAGSGKSTLLRWAAIQAARFRLGKSGTEDPIAIAPDIDSWLPRLVRIDEQRTTNPEAGLEGKGEARQALLRQELREASWCARLPFLISLRHTKSPFNLGVLQKLVVDLAGQPTDQWRLNDKMKSALLLFDGVDEVPIGEQRRAALKKIGQWATRFPDAQIVVTSRRGATPKSALVGFSRIELDELSDDQKARFIDHWHQALALELQWAGDDAVIIALAGGVRRELAGQRALSDLAANPLLCASLCALHWDRRREAALTAHRTGAAFRTDSYILPSDRWEICEALVQMLLQRREQQSLGFDIAAFPEAYRLSPKQKRAALVRVAYGMAENDMRSTMTRADAIQRIEQALVDMRGDIQAAPGEILDALLERSGVLRASEEDAIEFVHNTIKAYLAAHGYLMAEPATLIRKVAHAEPAELASGLDEVAVFCAASPTGAAFARPMMQQLLQQAEKLPPEQARLLRILAVRCEAAASTDFPPEARQPILALAPVLFPPRNMDEARQLAALGEEAIPRLAPTEGASDEEAAAAVRCLRLIGSQAADAAIDAYCNSAAPAVLEELAQARHPLLLPAVLDAAQDFFLWVKIPEGVKLRIIDAGPLEHLTNLQALSLNNTQVADLRPLERLTNLQQLYLDNTQVADLRPLERLTNLQRLSLNNTQVADLRPLERLTNLQDLYLSGPQVADLRPLERLTNLQQLYLNNTQVADLRPLERLTNLQRLSLDNTQVADLRPLERLTNLQRLYLNNTQVADLRPLERLTNLQQLYLNNTQVADLRPLERLTNLQDLYLSGPQVADLRPLERLTNLQDLYLSGPQVADLRPLERLTNLQRLSLDNTQVADLRPLERLTNLQGLFLDNTQVADLRPLERLTDLRGLSLDNTQVADEQVMRLQKALPNLTIRR